MCTTAVSYAKSVYANVICKKYPCIYELKTKEERNGFYHRAYASKRIEYLFDLLLVFPTSLAVTKGILVSFCCFAALTDMFKFSAYTRLS